MSIYETVASMRDALRETAFTARLQWARENRFPGKCPQCYAAGSKRREQGLEPVRPYEVCPHPNHWLEQRCVKACEDLVPTRDEAPTSKVEPKVEQAPDRPTPTPTQKPAPTRAPATDPISAAIEAVVRNVLGEVTGEAVTALAEQHETLRGKVEAALDGLDERIGTIAKNAAGYKGVALTLPDTSKVTMDGLFHEAFPELLKILVRRKQAYGYGPAGTGKTHLTAQLAAALSEAVGRPIRSTVQSLSVGTSEADLTGWLLPVEDGGRFTYVPSVFVDYYENGGLFGGDEMDNMDGNVAVVLNAALSNDSMVVVKRHGRELIKRNKDFYMVAWANTLGLGADAIYTARENLDGATRDRFAGSFVHVGYDAALERALAVNAAGGDHNAAEEAIQFVARVRAKIGDLGLARVASMRLTRAYAQDRAAGDSTTECRARALRDWSEDEAALVK